MDIEQRLNNIADREELIRKIRDYPDDVVVLQIATWHRDEDTAFYDYQHLGTVDIKQSLWMAMNFIDYIRSVKHSD
jgi:predicted metallo-beta-lactamase superfamily hydrolase